MNSVISFSHKALRLIHSNLASQLSIASNFHQPLVEKVILPIQIVVMTVSPTLFLGL